MQGKIEGSTVEAIEKMLIGVQRSSNLHRGSDNMGLRGFLRLPRIHRRKRSKARSEVENPSEAGPSLPPSSESTPDLRIGASTEPSNSQTIHAFPPPSHDTHRPFSAGGPVSGPGETIDPESSDPIVEPGAIDENKSNLRSLASSGARFILNGVKESADAFGPLKSVAGGLCFILDTCEVCGSPVCAAQMLTGTSANESE